jgi:hypothetical protein
MGVKKGCSSPAGGRIVGELCVMRVKIPHRDRRGAFAPRLIMAFGEPIIVGTLVEKVHRMT